MLGSAPVTSSNSSSTGDSSSSSKLKLTDTMLSGGDSDKSDSSSAPDKRRRTSASETPGTRFPTLDTKSATEDRNAGKSPKAQVSGVIGPNNNSAGDSRPHPTRSTFRVGVTEDTNRKCRRTMEDTHSYLYNFLPPVSKSGDPTNTEEEFGDDGYFAIFDGHAGTYAAEWCGKKLHLVLEETIRKNPGKPIPDMLDATFTACDGQLEKLPVKNSGCTAVTAVLRWEYRTPEDGAIVTADTKGAERLRVLYTANVGDARIILCRDGKALRLSYDHKGSDENEGRRVANAGGLILNNRVNGVLAVTRALGDSYMKELVTGHPYTTETVLSKDDEFILLACDGLWDVCSDQEAVDLVRDIDDPQEASKRLVDHALERFSSDNLSCMIVRLDHNKNKQPAATEAEKIPAKPEGESSKTDAVTTEKVLEEAVPAKEKPPPVVEKGEGPKDEETVTLNT